MWAFLRPEGYRHIFDSQVAVRMCGDGSEEVKAVKVSLDLDGPFYGWLPTDRDFPSLVYEQMVLLDICFPYGVDAAFRAGHGRIVRLRVEPLEAT